MTPELMKKYIALLFAMAILPFAAIAQQIIDLPQLDQLPIHSIHRIFQDSEGYVWYGTSDGLCRDDGYKVQVFRSDLHTPDLMQSNLIYSIAEDSNNRLWFGTDRGVYILDKATYSISRLDRPEINGIKVSCVGSTSDGDIWICVPGGLCRFSPDGELKTRYTIDKGQGRINSFYEDFDRRIWICVEGEGLCRLEPETGDLESFSRAGEADESYIIQDKNRKYYWVGSWGEGIHRFDPDAAPGKRYTPQPAAFSRQSRHDNCIINMTQDDVDGRLWVITYNNLEAYRISAQGMLEPVDTSPYLPEGNKMLSYVIKDRDRNLWVAAYDRDSFIINLQDSHITEYQVPEMRKNLNVNPAVVSLCEDDEKGLFWLSQDRHGIYLYSPSSGKLVPVSDSPGMKGFPWAQIPYLIKSKERGKIWAMTDYATVYGLRRTGMSVKWEDTVDLGTASEDPGTLETIYEDASGCLWMGTTKGLFVLRPDSGEISAVQCIKGNAAGITEMTDGSVWVCVSKAGVYKFEDGEVTGFFPSGENLSCIGATSDGKLWLGSFCSKILYLDPSDGTYADFTSVCGMKGDVLEMMLVDEFNHLWILTNQQVKEFNPHNGSFRDYTVPGKPYMLERYLPRAAYMAADNTLYFGGIPGFISIKASNRLESLAKPATPLITNVSVGGESLFFDRHIPSEGKFEIGPDSYNIEISFSTLDYWNASRIRYAYKLSGVDKEWNYTNGGNTAFYNRLGKGKYTFQVKATDENGLWSDRVSSISITRLPAWYETWWAFLLWSAMAAGLVFMVLYLYVQKVRQQEKRKITNLLRPRRHKQEASRKPSVLEISSLETSSKDERLVARAQQLVESNLGDPLFNIAVLADRLNMTRITLSRKIKAVTGQTPLEFIRDIKMRHACRMLENPAMTVSEVVAALGYNDHDHFTSLFKKTFGMTPSEYQKRKASPMN